MLIDCHTHLDEFTDDEVGTILDRARTAGVDVVVTAGTTLASSARAVELSGRFGGLFAGVGVHPMDLEGPLDDGAIERLEELATATDRVVMVSEIGLDFMAGAPDRAVQYQALRQQVGLARALGYPVVFHTRDSHDETLRVLREERAYEIGGAMHYFQADLSTARRAIDLGFYISLARPLLRLAHLQEVAAALPLDRIVLETDTYPQPFKAKREKWIEPRHVSQIAEKLAQLKGSTIEHVAEATTRNFLNMLGRRKDAVTEHF